MATIIGAAEIIAAMAEEEAEVLDAAAAVAAVDVDTTTTVVVEAAVISAGADGYYDRDGGDYGRGGGDPYYRRDARDRFNDLASTTCPRDYPQTRIMVAEEVIHTTVMILGREEATMTGEVTMTGLRPRETTP